LSARDARYEAYQNDGQTVRLLSYASHHLKHTREKSKESRRLYENGAVNLRQTGDGTWTTCPVELSRPVF